MAKINFDWASCQMFYENHISENPAVEKDVIDKETSYSFFADMAVKCTFSSGEKLLNELKSYVKRMLNKYCKGNRNAYCVMVDSLCLLSNILYNANGNETDSVVDWCGDTYRDLFYNKNTYLKYITEYEMMSIWRELN